MFNYRKLTSIKFYIVDFCKSYSKNHIFSFCLLVLTNVNKMNEKKLWFTEIFRLQIIYR